MDKTVILAGAVVFALAGCGAQEVVLTGERLDLRAESDEGAVQDRSAPIGLPAPVARSGWTHRGAGPSHDSGHNAFTTAPRLAFAAPIGEGEGRRHRISADPVVSGARIFTVDSRARVTATSTGGRTLWSRDLTPAGEPSDDASGAGLAVDGNRLYVSTAFGDVVALDVATGRPYWTQELDAAAAGAPTVAGDLVYVVARDATAWAIDAASGRVEWTELGTPSPSGVVGGAAPAVSGNMVVMPFASRELAGVMRQAGTRLWTSVVAGTRPGRVYASITDISGDPVIAGSRVYAGSPSGRIDAYELRTGEQVWSAQEGAMSPVVVAGGSVFAVSDQAELVRLDAASGERIWGTPLPFFQNGAPKRRQAVYAHYGPVLAGGHLWVASSDGNLRGFSPESGALVAQAALPGGAASNPVVAARTLYVVSGSGQLLAFR